MLSEGLHCLCDHSSPCIYAADLGFEHTHSVVLPDQKYNLLYHVVIPSESGLHRILGSDFHVFEVKR